MVFAKSYFGFYDSRFLNGGFIIRTEGLIVISGYYYIGFFLSTTTAVSGLLNLKPEGLT